MGPAKAEATFGRRGIHFETAIRIFDRDVIEWCDIRAEYDEIRVVAIRVVDGEVLVVVYTDRGDVRRIISARRAGSTERKRWRETFERSA